MNSRKNKIRVIQELFKNSFEDNIYTVDIPVGV